MSWMVKEEKCAGCGWPAVARVRATKDDPFEPVCEECRLVIVRRIQHAAHKLAVAGPNLMTILPWRLR